MHARAHTHTHTLTLSLATHTGGVSTPADAALMMQLGIDGVFVGSGIFKSGDPAKRARAIVQVCVCVRLRACCTVRVSACVQESGPYALVPCRINVGSMCALQLNCLRSLVFVISSMLHTHTNKQTSAHTHTHTHTHTHHCRPSPTTTTPSSSERSAQTWERPWWASTAGSKTSNPMQAALNKRPAQCC